MSDLPNLDSDLLPAATPSDGPALKAHWGLEDPSHVEGDEAAIDAAFQATLAHIERRCRAFLALPLADMSRDELQQALNRIGQE